ncbi:MAG: SDR family oxidoreductase [Acidobacteriota bacterium]|nr:SDR family oxidoreductase [Acidobacteriota bacterium]
MGAAFTDSALDGKVAFVAGASQGGTGTGSAIRLAAEGARVAICARNRSKLRDTLERIEAVGGTGVMFECDLANPGGGRSTLIERTEDALGPVDYLVYVAAYGGYAPFETLSRPSLQKALEVNVHAPLELIQQVVAGLRRRRAPGSIVTIGTKAARPITGPPFPDTPPATAGLLYGSTKAALARLTQSVAVETYGQGISVNVLSPQSAIATPALRAAGWIPEEMFEPVETMVEAVLALLTGDPEVLTGQDLLSIDLLYALRRPVYDLTGTRLVEGWQPDDLPAFIEARSRPFTLKPPTRPAAG